MKTFKPDNLPLREIDWHKILDVLGPANRALARYDGMLNSIPNPNVLLSQLQTQEAVLSSKIEGTQATLQEVLKYEAGQERPYSIERRNDIYEVINYRKALASAVEELDHRPLSLNLIKRLHAVLMSGVRGAGRAPGEFRRIQNWIGKSGSSIEEARFVPPSVLDLERGLDDLEKYMHYEEKDILVQLAIIHAQFEILHPFLDGNGRIGRILIPLFLFEKGILHKPMFYISPYLEKNRELYYDKLKNITDQGEWTDWIIFFLTALKTQAKINISKARSILSLYDMLKKEVVRVTHSQLSINAIDTIFNMPVFNSTDFAIASSIPKTSVQRLLSKLVDSELLIMAEKGLGRNPSIYMFPSLIDIIERSEKIDTD